MILPAHPQSLLMPLAPHFPVGSHSSPFNTTPPPRCRAGPIHQPLSTFHPPATVLKSHLILWGLISGLDGQSSSLADVFKAMRMPARSWPSLQPGIGLTHGKLGSEVRKNCPDILVRIPFLAISVPLRPHLLSFPHPLAPPHPSAMPEQTFPKSIKTNAVQARSLFDSASTPLVPPGFS